MSRNSSVDFSRFRNNFKRFEAELQNKKISTYCRIIIDKDIINGIHGRWIISKNLVFNIPPINSILMGQYDEFLKTSEIPPFEDWWANSLDIINDWNILQTSLGT